MKSASVRKSWCQSIAVSANGGLSRGKGRAAGSGFCCHCAWKTEGNEDSSISKGGDMLERALGKRCIHFRLASCVDSCADGGEDGRRIFVVIETVRI